MSDLPNSKSSVKIWISANTWQRSFAYGYAVFFGYPLVDAAEVKTSQWRVAEARIWYNQAELSEIDETYCTQGSPLRSSNIGPEKVFSATVVGMTDTLKIRAALATGAALLRKVTGSIDLVANAICD
jgi:hypothetical protein